MTIATQLTEAELDRLETLLDDPSLGDAMRLDEIQGYLCASLAGPVQIPLEDRLQEILGDESAQDSDAAREAKELLLRFAAALEASLDSDDNFPLLLYPKDESEDAPSDFELWCLAYLHGVDSAIEDWFDS
ncbi:MAG: YecA family protein, partial [Candidatus Accumulibacter sp.]|nr:YecA family protein [Accumulibacter sp.]